MSTVSTGVQAEKTALIAEVEGSVAPELIARVRAIRGVWASKQWKYRVYRRVCARHGFPAEKALRVRKDRLCKAFTIEQAYLIAGWEMGEIFTESGLLIETDGLPPAEVGGEAALARERTSAIGIAARTLVKVAAIRDELEWVAAHLHEDLPDFGGAPSVTACNMWVSVKTNATFERDFWNAHLKRRQPGMAARERESPFVEDSGVDRDDAQERDEALERRLTERLGEG